MEVCSTWVPKDGTVASQLVKDTDVGCVQKTDSTCLSRVEVAAEWKMVRFGTGSLRNSEGTMFNMSALKDVKDMISGRYSMGDRWDHPETLRFRHITLRVYVGEGGEHMLCAVFNTYGVPNDGLGRYAVSTTVKGVTGQTMRWVACDDRRECSGGPGNTLSTNHRGVFTHSDGWCVKPLERESGPVSVKFSKVVGMEGISFQLSDGDEQSYYFETGDQGMTGVVDDNGLVTDGDIPEILFDLAGIQVPE